MLDAATKGQLDDGAGAATRRGPRDHACRSDAACCHRLAEHPRETMEESCATTAREPTAAPRACRVAELAFQLSLETTAVAPYVHHVNVELVHSAVPTRIGDESTPCTSTPRT